LGSAAGTLFAIALLASGLSSSAVGTMAGQVVMQGFLEFRIPLWVRRVATMAPALLVIGLGANPTRTLVLSQVVLSFALPFAVVPLVVFSSRKRLMGPLVNRPATTAVAAGIATLIVAVNIYLLWETFFGS
jgi:manganese transport protein